MDLTAHKHPLEDLPVDRKLFIALLVLLVTIVVIANLVFISASYWITRQIITPQALHSLARLYANPQMSQQMLSSQEMAGDLLRPLEGYAPLHAAAVYDGQGQLLAQYQQGDEVIPLPERIEGLTPWLQSEDWATTLVDLRPPGNAPPGHLLLLASRDLPTAFFIGTFSATLGIILISILLWMLLAKQVRRLISRPILQLEQLSRRVTLEKDFSLRADPKSRDEIGRLTEAFNAMLSRIQSHGRELKDARDQARALLRETHHSNRQLKKEVEVRGKMEKKLRSFQNYLNSIIDSMPSALIAVDEELYVTQWNKEASLVSGSDPEDAIDQPIFLAFPHLKPFAELLRRSVLQHRVEKVHRVTWEIEGAIRHFALTVYPLNGDSGKGGVIRIDDVTERLVMQDMMVQSEKMLSVGGLAAGMAHEVNNPLGAILHNIQNIQRRLSPDLEKNLEAAREAHVPLQEVNRYLELREIPGLLNAIQQAGTRAAKIVTNMLAFSRRSDREIVPYQLAELIRQSVEIAEADFYLGETRDHPQIQIVYDLAPDIDTVPLIPNEIEQVLLNLLKNAAQAIFLHDDPTFRGYIHIRTCRRSQWAEIQVEDNGIGISEAIRKRIFEPFFTTKEVGQGTGLGLSVSYFIVTNNHNGQLEVHSAQDRGTCFILRLPMKARTRPQGHQHV